MTGIPGAGTRQPATAKIRLCFVGYIIPASAADCIVVVIKGHPLVFHRQ